MDEEKDKDLCTKYPNLYRDRHADMRHTCMCWGFTCGDGWYELIDKLSAALETEIVKLKESGVPVEQLPVAAQVKEKFGGLRCYVDNATEEMYKLIEAAEEKSFTICEDCGGAEGELRGGGWLRTLCDACNAERKEIPK